MNKNLLTLAALGAVCLLPATGVFADQNDTTLPGSDSGASVSGTNDNKSSDRGMNNNTSGTSSTTTETTTVTETTTAPANAGDVEAFRDQLHLLRTLFTRMRENRRLALASEDPLAASQYMGENRNLEQRALGLLDSINRTWRRVEPTTLAAQTASAGENATDRFGTANAVRYANESEDTALVRNATWDLQETLNADKLNGRGPVVTDRMMAELDAAINRAENPSFRLAEAAASKWRITQELHLSRPEDIQFSEPPARAPSNTTAEAPTTSETTTTNENTNENTNETTTAPSNETAQAPTTSENANETTNETNETTMGAGAGGANLPQTGGDPSLLFMLGSGIAGLGMIVRKRGR